MLLDNIVTGRLNSANLMNCLFHFIFLIWSLLIWIGFWQFIGISFVIFLKEISMQFKVSVLLIMSFGPRQDLKNCLIYIQKNIVWPFFAVFYMQTCVFFMCVPAFKHQIEFNICSRDKYVFFLNIFLKHLEKLYENLNRQTKHAILLLLWLEKRTYKKSAKWKNKKSNHCSKS